MPPPPWLAGVTALPCCADVNYCIVSGWCNPLLDAGVMLALERAIHRATGVEPRGWSEPQAGWREMTPEEAAAADQR